VCRQNEGFFGFAKRWLMCRAKPNVPESVSVFIIFLLCLYAAKIFLSLCRCLFSRLACNVKHFIHRFQAKVAKKWDVQLFVGRFLFVS